MTAEAWSARLAALFRFGLHHWLAPLSGAERPVHGPGSVGPGGHASGLDASGHGPCTGCTSGSATRNPGASYLILGHGEPLPEGLGRQPRLAGFPRHRLENRPVPTQSGDLRLVLPVRPGVRFERSARGGPDVPDGRVAVPTYGGGWPDAGVRLARERLAVANPQRQPVQCGGCLGAVAQGAGGQPGGSVPIRGPLAVGWNCAVRVSAPGRRVALRGRPCRQRCTIGLPVHPKTSPALKPVLQGVVPCLAWTAPLGPSVSRCGCCAPVREGNARVLTTLPGPSPQHAFPG